MISKIIGAVVGGKVAQGTKNIGGPVQQLVLHRL